MKNVVKTLELGDQLFTGEDPRNNWFRIHIVGLENAIDSHRLALLHATSSLEDWIKAGSTVIFLGVMLGAAMITLAIIFG